jgi:hypothetical protein
VPDTKVSRPYSSETFYELVAKLNFQFDLENDVYEINLDSSLIAIQNKFPDVTAEEELKATKLLISRLPEQPVNWQAILFREFKGEVPVITTIEDFRFILRAQLNRLRDLAQDMSAGLLLDLIRPDTLKRSQFANVLFQTLLQHLVSSLCKRNRRKPSSILLALAVDATITLLSPATLRAHHTTIRPMSFIESLQSFVVTFRQLF